MERRGESQGHCGVLPRRGCLRTILAFALGFSGAPGVWAQPARTTSPGTRAAPIRRSAELPRATDLASDGTVSRRERKPILLFFDRQECPYCEQALREYLVPMAHGEWKDRALFRMIDIDRELPLVDFDGKALTHRAIAARYRVVLSPTVLMVDGGGKPLASAIVGLLTVDFYGAYLEDVLSRAADRLAR